MRALFVLTPAESKRLIGKAVANMQEVKHAKEHAKILIGHGSTNVFVAEELLGKESLSKLFPRNTYLSGAVMRGTLCTIPAGEKPPILVLNRGTPEPPAATMAEILRDFGHDSLFIKGADAVDHEGNAAAFMAHPEGGTIGWAIGTILARGIRLIVPVGLEKLIPSIRKAVSHCGQQTFDYCQGLRVGLMPLSGASVVTEIEALRILAGVDSFHVASGGCGGSEGAVVLVAEGPREAVEKAINIIEPIKGEPPLAPPKGDCFSCVVTSPAQKRGEGTVESPSSCTHQGKTEKDIPVYLRKM
jgi:hypothetical protein